VNRPPSAAPPPDDPAEHCTDFGNAARLVAEYGRYLRYCWPWAQWLVWDDGRWAPDRCGHINNLAKLTVRGIALEAAREENDEHRRRLLRHAAASESDHRMQAMIRVARSDLPVLPEELDSDPWLFNVQNGTLDLRTGSLRPHNPDDFITKLAPVEFQPNATCLRWLAFLDRVLQGDQALITFLQRGVGYTLSGETVEEVLFFLHGSGQNGKTKFLELLARLMGDYFKKAAFTTFLAGPRNVGAPRNDLAELAGARLVTAVEAGEEARFAEAFLKEVTGGDTVSARFLYAESFQFRPAFKLWFGANHKPKIRGNGPAMWRRMRLIPFTVTIPEAERDTRLLDKLTEELPGILTWAVEGCLAWQRSGLGQAPAVVAATAGYQNDMDVLAGFLEQECDLTPTAKTQSSWLFKAYKEWAVRNEERVFSQTAFSLNLEERGFLRVKDSAGRRHWVGIGLNGSTAGTAGSGGFYRKVPYEEEAREKTGNGGFAGPNPPYQSDDELYGDAWEGVTP
jgi:putative DNA primase/helicase